jgi:hypothetical protein
MHLNKLRDLLSSMTELNARLGASVTELSARLDASEWAIADSCALLSRLARQETAEIPLRAAGKDLAEPDGRS